MVQTPGYRNRLCNLTKINFCYCFHYNPCGRFLVGCLVGLFLFEERVGDSFYLSTILSFHKQWMTFPVGSEKGRKRAKLSSCVHLGQHVLAWLWRQCSTGTDKGQLEYQFVIHFVIFCIKSCYFRANVTSIASHTILSGILLLFSSLSWEVYLLVSQPSRLPVQTKWTCRECWMLLCRAQSSHAEWSILCAK